MTPSQEKGCEARKRRRELYHGVECIQDEFTSGESQRHSLLYGNISQTGRPNAPARWATAVSIEIIKSIFESSCAVAAKSIKCCRRSCTFGRCKNGSSS